MSADRHFHYDFGTERRLDGWRVARRTDDIAALETTFETTGDGRFALAFDPKSHPDNLRLLDCELNGEKRIFDWGNSSIAYVTNASSYGLRYAFDVALAAGKHSLLLNLKTRFENPETRFGVTLIPEEAPVAVPKPADRVFAVPAAIFEDDRRECPDLKAFTPGVGNDACAGRFGYTKGDGVLDLAMPILGVIDKMYLCGHPKYLKPYKWTFSVLPSGVEQAAAYHGSFPPAQVGLENDRLEVNHLSVRWGTTFATTGDFFEREAGKSVDFSCHYSLASPGVLIETSDPGVSLSKLESAGNYRYLLVPRADGVHRVALSEGLVFPDDMSENWLLLFGTTEFPDLPILLVFASAPTEISVTRTANERLSSLAFHMPGKGATAFVATPFGIESRAPISPDDADFIMDAATRCRFWSRAFLAFPVKHEERFKLDEETEKVEIVQTFGYRVVRDQWGTKPLRTAPLPPALALLDGTGMVDTDADVRDFQFPTKYGFLKGAVGRDFVSYKIPYMPRARQFPLKDSLDAKISETLSEDLNAYFAFHENFSSDRQAYPYAGSALEPYAWAAPLFNFMDAASRAKLSAKLSERLGFACDPERRYVYPIIDWGALMRENPGVDRVLEIYRDPAMKYLNLYNWYSRKEPFTGAAYRICYLNVCLFSGGKIKEGTREEIAGLKMPLIENDWGAGLTFYYIYLAAQISGDFEPIRKNWETLREGFDYFERPHDWACMATAYSDNGISWVEGANYGAFTSFVNLAEAVGDKKSYAKGVYLAAKQLALRLAKFRSAQTYFYRFFDRAPWYGTKTFHEEAMPGTAFQNVPELWKDTYRLGVIYNLTTEGLYPEIFSALNRFIPEEFAYVRDFALKSYEEGLAGKNTGWGHIQECCSCLLAAALSEDYDAGHRPGGGVPGRRGRPLYYRRDHRY